MEERDAPGANGFGAAPAAPATDEALVRVPFVQGPVRPWALATVAFALLWLLTLAWGLHRRPMLPVSTPVPPPAPKSGRPGPAHLRHALEHGGLDDIAAALCAMAPAAVAEVEGLHAWLDDPGQRAALEALQRARWAGGDVVAARRQLREAFARGPRWRVAEAAAGANPILPPLYPQR